MSEPKPSTATMLALLSAKIDANQDALEARLDSTHELVSVNITHQNARIDSQTQRMDGIDVRVTSNTDRITKLETERAATTGEKRTWVAIIGLALTAFGAWFADHFFNLNIFK